jgi:hypothetical protein
LNRTASFAEIRTQRDILLLRFAKNRMLVVACDSAGGIGPKSLDRVRASGEVVGRFTARVALMEALSVGATPFCVVSTLSVEPYPATQIIKGIRSELRRAKLKGNVPIMRSTEKNILVRQTGVGVTVLATVSRGQLRIGKSRLGDLVVTIGLPHVGSEVIQGEKKCRIADLRDLLTLLEFTGVHEIIPVGSVGILREAKVIAEDSGLKFRSTSPDGINLGKSAGPATVLLCSVSPSNYEDLSSLTNKPVTTIGTLEKPGGC